MLFLKLESALKLVIPVKSVFIGLLIMSICNADDLPDKEWFIKSVTTPAHINLPPNKSTVLIAIVDDGINTSHEIVTRFIWKNSDEIPANNIDDDGNGYIDDISGWDVSDNNNQPIPHASRLNQYYHGTHLAGIITQILSHSLGDDASDKVRILPVKAISDSSPDTYIREGYKGINYAIEMGADIILTAWGVATISESEIKILEKARSRGILIIASAGNLPEEKKQFPAAHESVLAVGALSQNDIKTRKSSYGQFVDLSAPGIDIYSADTLSNTDYAYREGTSLSAAIVTAAATLVRLTNPAFDHDQLRQCLINSATTLDNIKPVYRGKLGAGKLNIESAINCNLLTGHDDSQYKLTRPQGFMRITAEQKTPSAWTITPTGRFKGLRFKVLSRRGQSDNSNLVFSVYDGNQLVKFKSYALTSLPTNIFIPHTSASISLENESADLDFEYIIEYKVETIDFTKEFCRDTSYLYKEGFISDGSNSSDYAYNSNCKWLITAPEGKVIKFEFSEFDTEPKIDKIYFFNGKGTHEPVMAIFSGPKIPPVLTTWEHQVLVWFVSDGKNQGAGWKLKYNFVNP